MLEKLQILLLYQLRTGHTALLCIMEVTHEEMCVLCIWKCNDYKQTKQMTWSGWGWVWSLSQERCARGTNTPRMRFQAIAEQWCFKKSSKWKYTKVLSECIQKYKGGQSISWCTESPPNQKKVSTSSPCVYLTPNATATFVNPHEFFSSGEQTRL